MLRWQGRLDLAQPKQWAWARPRYDSSIPSLILGTAPGTDLILSQDRSVRTARGKRAIRDRVDAV